MSKPITSFANLRDFVVATGPKKGKKGFVTPSSWDKGVMGLPITELTEDQLVEAVNLALTDKIDVFGRPRRSLKDILDK